MAVFKRLISILGRLDAKIDAKKEKLEANLEELEDSQEKRP
jgi:hypothetical protein